MRVWWRSAVLLCATVALAACTITMQGAQPQDSQFAYYPKPAVGEFLCLSSVPGTPVYSRPVGGLGSPNLLGYTKDVVAFGGEQQGGQIMIVYYNGLDGWIDGAKIAPFRAAYPGQRCIVPGRDLSQRPIFEID